MNIVVGIGNPGPEYEGTRHNVGFEVIDRLAARRGDTVAKVRYNALTADLRIDDCRAFAMKPMTYVNRSGVAVAQAANFYKSDPAQVLVVCDDADLEPGTLRLRREGSSGGHNGLKSIETSLGTRAYPRLRVGIGRRGGRELTGHVLGRFSKSEREAIEPALERAADAVETWLTEGVTAAMNRYNGPADR